VSGFRRPPSIYQFASFRAFTQIPQGTELTLVRDGFRFYLELTGDRVGELTDESVSDIAPLWDRWKEDLYVVSATAASSRRTGTLVAVRPAH